MRFSEIVDISRMKNSRKMKCSKNVYAIYRFCANKSFPSHRKKRGGGERRGLVGYACFLTKKWYMISSDDIQIVSTLYHRRLEYGSSLSKEKNHLIVKVLLINWDLCLLRFSSRITFAKFLPQAIDPVKKDFLFFGIWSVRISGRR